MKIGFFLIFMTIIGCAVNNKSYNKKQIKLNNENSINNHDNNFIVKINDSIFASLKTVFYNEDSIIVYTTINNTTSEDLYLYKSLLPSDRFLKENVFNCIAEDSKEVLKPEVFFSDTAQGKYSESEQGVPIVIPILDSDKFILLNSKTESVFKINITRFYNFKPLISKGYKKFSLAYGAMMPLVDNQFKKVYEIENKESKPVYFAILPSYAPENSHYLGERSFFNID